MRHYEFKSHMDNQVSGLPQPIKRQFSLKLLIDR